MTVALALFTVVVLLAGAAVAYRRRRAMDRMWEDLQSRMDAVVPVKVTPMSPETEDHIVNAMPAAEREDVRARLRAAVAAGWSGIGIWDGWDGVLDKPLPADGSDLFGVPPGKLFGCKPIP